MSQTQVGPMLDRLLDPVTRSLSAEAAEKLLHLRADAEFQDRLDLLADRCTEGQLTPEERDEYDTYVRAIHIIGILQAKVRRTLGQPTGS